MPHRDGIDHSLRQTTLISAIYPVGPAAIILMPLIVSRQITAHTPQSYQTSIWV